MNEKSNLLFARLKVFSLDIVSLYAALPRTDEARVLGSQLLRSGTSPGAQYAEARRAKSTRDFISKIEGGLLELEETGYWLELIAGAGIVRPERLIGIRRETEELIRIFVTIAKNAKGKQG